MNARFLIREIRFDPWQMAAVAQRLASSGLPMIEFPQTSENLTESSTNFYELIKGGNLSIYPDDDIRLAVGRCIALPSSRGWKISKEKQSHKIDVVVALAMAALGAMQYGARGVIDFQEIKRLNDALHYRSSAMWSRHIIRANFITARRTLMPSSIWSTAARR